MTHLIEGPPLELTLDQPARPPTWQAGERLRVHWPGSIDDLTVVTVHDDVVVIRPSGGTRRIPREHLELP